MENEKVDKSEQPKEKQIEAESFEDIIPINFRIPSRFPSLYATNIVVQETPDEVVISFFEIIHPMLPPEEANDRTAYINALKERGVTAECISRITVAKHKFPSFAQIMNATSQQIIKEFESFGENADNTPND